MKTRITYEFPLGKGKVTILVESEERDSPDWVAHQAAKGLKAWEDTLFPPIAVVSNDPHQPD